MKLLGIFVVIAGILIIARASVWPFHPAKVSPHTYNLQLEENSQVRDDLIAWLLETYQYHDGPMADVLVAKLRADLRDLRSGYPDTLRAGDRFLITARNVGGQKVSHYIVWPSLELQAVPKP